jgi:hypothetical protein
MNSIRAIACFLMFCSSTAWGATLTWNPNSEPDLAGYRIYQCSLLPCTKSSGTLLVTLGTGTSFTIGTPASTHYYYITAYDSAINESGTSNLVTYTPVGSSPPPPPSPPMTTVRLTVVGNPAAGMWGVEGDTTDLRNVMATVLLDGVVHHVEHTAPYGFPDDNGLTAMTGRFGTGSHTVEFVFYLEGTTTEIGRAKVTVQEGSPSAPPPPPAMRNVNLTVVGFPAAGMWGVEGSTTDPRDVMATVFLDGVVHHVEHTAPYGFPNDNGLTATTGRFGTGSHKVEFVFYLEGTTTEIGRANVTVQEGTP